jgi:hypothetical protein
MPVGMTTHKTVHVCPFRNDIHRYLFDSPFIRFNVYV